MKRIKRALFELFRDEILNFVGHHKHVTEVIRVEQDIKFTEIKAEIRLEESERNSYPRPPEIVYEEALRCTKERLFERVMEHVQVDTRSIVDEFPREGRIIKLSLYVGKKQ